MSIRDLKIKYGGKNLKNRDAVNRAIRAELVGGDDLLDALESVDRLCKGLLPKDHRPALAGLAEAQAALDHLRTLREIMGNEIANRYGFGGKT